MATRNIVKKGDPILNKTCRPVEKFDDRLFVLIDDMKETLIKNNGVGLAAPQVGILRRVAIVCVDDDDGMIELINPVIVEEKGEQLENEGCLSCPGVYATTKRPMYVKVEALDRHGNKVTYQGKGLKARAFCHEIDHLDGILFLDHAIKILETQE